MGRHHEDFKGVNAGLASDGHSFLPAFDTMLRVLSIGSPLESYNGSRNYGGRVSTSSYSARNGDSSPLRRNSSSSRTSISSPKRGIPERNNPHNTEVGMGLLDKHRVQQNTGARVTTPIVKMSSDSKPRKTSSQSKYDMSKRSASVTRLLSTGRRVSQAIRSRSSSGSHAYVGRHSYSVMSKKSSACSLVMIWLLFVVMCFFPVAIRRSGVSSAICPDVCQQVEIDELIKIKELNFKNLEYNLESTSAQNGLENITVSNRKLKPEPIRNSMTSTDPVQMGDKKRDINSFADAPHADGGTEDKMEVERQSPAENTNPTVTAIYEPHTEVWSDADYELMNKTFKFKSLLPDKNKSQREKKIPDLPAEVDVLKTGYCAPYGYQIYSVPSSAQGAITVPKKVYEAGDKKQTAEFKDSQILLTSTSQTTCSSCSSAFFPLSKSHMIFNALVIFLTWVWMIISASRLLYLRKHSTNVFVRCSALWRFMFLTAAFYSVTLAPYAGWIVLDFSSASPAYKSRLWYLPPPSVQPIVSESMISGDPVPGDDNIGSTTDILPDNGDERGGGGQEFSPVSSDVEYMNQMYGVVATCLVLLNFAITPTLYLVRLLGFRRIVSAL